MVGDRHVGAGGSVAQRRVRFMLTQNYGTAPIAVPRLANSPVEFAHMLYEALLIRDEFAKILSIKITINLCFNLRLYRIDYSASDTQPYVYKWAYGRDSNAKFDR